MIKAKDEVEEVLGQPDIPLSAAQRLTERRTLLALGVAECAFRSRRRPGGVGRDPPPDCGVLWKMAQLGKRARATPPARLRGGCARQRPLLMAQGMSPALRGDAHGQHAGLYQLVRLSLSRQQGK